MFELIDDFDRNRTWRNVCILGGISLFFLVGWSLEYIHRDVFRVVLFPVFLLVGIGDYWKRINRYSPNRLWVLIRIVPPILVAIAGWYESWVFYWISLVGCFLVLIALDNYLKHRAGNREQLAEVGKAQP